MPGLGFLNLAIDDEVIDFRAIPFEDATGMQGLCIVLNDRNEQSHWTAETDNLQLTHKHNEGLC
jgi:hypothetical protein